MRSIGELSGQYTNLDTDYTERRALAAVGAGNDKTVTVPAGEDWEIVMIDVTITTTAMTGTRNLDISFEIGEIDFVFGLIEPGNNQTGAKIILQDGGSATPSSAQFFGAFASNLRLAPGDIIRIKDVANIDPNDNYAFNVLANARARRS